MSCQPYTPLGVTLLLTGAMTQAGAPAYVNSRQILLTFQTAAGAPVERVDLWVSPDEGRNWRRAAAELAGATVVRYNAPGDGRFAFYLVLVNAAGPSADPPGHGSEPHATVIVDTIPPALQVHDATLSRGPDQALRLVVSLSLIEENLADTGVRVFYRTTAESPWRDGGPVPVVAGQLAWQLPDPAPKNLDFRLVATDRAGNQAWEQIDNLALRPQTRAAQPAATPPNPVLIEPVSKTVVEPVAHVTFETRSPPQPAAAQPADSPVARLRRLAQRYAAEGQFAPAAARLEDAVAAAPNDADLLVDLGNVLYRAGRHDEAARRFEAATRLAPDHLGALEGLALVAAGKNRYAQARDQLERLLRLKPEAGRFWLHYGDMQHKLGDAPAAVQAWQRVLGAKEADDRVLEKAKARLKYFAPTSRPARP